MEIAPMTVHPPAVQDALELYTWTHNLSPKKSIEVNIKKARRAFCALGSLDISHGKQNPLTSESVFCPSACMAVRMSS